MFWFIFFVAVIIGLCICSSASRHKKSRQRAPRRIPQPQNRSNRLHPTGHGRPLQTGYGQLSSSGYGQQYPSGYGQQYPSGYDQQFPSGYGQQYPSGYDQQFPSGYGQQYPSGYDQQYPSGYGQQYPSGYDQQFPSGYGQPFPGTVQYNPAELHHHCAVMPPDRSQHFEMIATTQTYRFNNGADYPSGPRRYY